MRRRTIFPYQRGAVPGAGSRGIRARARDGLSKALGSLDARSRRIIEARWLKEKDTATLHELAGEFKISAERVRQIEVKALEKMRKAFGDEGLPALPSPA